MTEEKRSKTEKKVEKGRKAEEKVRKASGKNKEPREGVKRETKEGKSVKKEVTEEKPKAEKKKRVSKEALGEVKRETGEGKSVKKEVTEEKPKAEKKKPKEKVIENIKFFRKKELSTDEMELISKRKKKPRFIRQELYKLKRLKDTWRRPRGIDSKKQEGKRGKGKLPGIGYKNPESVRDIDPSGYCPVLIHNTRELGVLNSGKEAAIISGSVGRRKRNEIIKSANKLKITILNPRKGEV